ncbi:MAG TPA: DUF2244 domain-containing protein [Burkholderiales bacterium]|nr:DUF2244 domain-containing protein [Burkholderiales bacterium]
MNSVAGGEAAEYVYIARRNNSLSSSARLLVFGFILTVSLGIAAAFSLIFGAWPILPFAGLEMVVLYLALRYVDVHAGDYERITIRNDSVAVEVCEGADVKRFELNRCWAQVVCEGDGARLALRSHGRDVHVGRHLREEQRREMARELARELQKGTHR